MHEENTIISKTSDFVARLFRERLPDHLPYHTFDHTQLVVDTARKIGKKIELGEEGLEIVVLAAWLHDVGYIEVYKGHEEVSVRIAKEFLQQEQYPPEKIELVAGCIRATKIPQMPHNLLEEIVADADLSGFGRKSFFDHSELIQSEWQSALGKFYTDEEWAQQNLELLAGHTFFTPYARKAFSKQKDENIRLLQKKLRKMKPRNEKNDDQMQETWQSLNYPETETHQDPDIKTLLSIGANKIQELSLSDRKAQTLIISSSIIFCVGLLGLLWWDRSIGVPFLLLVLGSAASIVCSVFALLPSKVHPLSTDDLRDTDSIYSSLLRNLEISEVIRKKQNTLLNLAYVIFISYICLSVLSILILFLTSRPGSM